MSYVNKKMAPRAGIEPTTHCLEGSCSDLYFDLEKLPNLKKL